MVYNFEALSDHVLASQFNFATEELKDIAEKKTFLHSGSCDEPPESLVLDYGEPNWFVEQNLTRYEKHRCRLFGLVDNQVLVLQRNR